MKLPRDVSGEDLAKRLRKLGSRIKWQTGGHVTIPKHGSLQVGTVAALLDGVGRHHGTRREEKS